MPGNGLGTGPARHPIHFLHARCEALLERLQRTREPDFMHFRTRCRALGPDGFRIFVELHRTNLQELVAADTGLERMELLGRWPTVDRELVLLGALFIARSALALINLLENSEDGGGSAGGNTNREAPSHARLASALPIWPFEDPDDPFREG